MKNIIVGTAGHIDHGKTTLVRALTGIDTDRLEEEKRRGISIDLGFAHLERDGVRYGFVDVPGHERFVKNMLAGAAGIDAVVLVIGADESIKPQTREHFEICRLLGIRHGVVALTKIDQVDAEIVELVRLEAAEFVAGSFLEGAAIVGVSGVTGAGLEELKAALGEVARKVEARRVAGPMRLPVDRSFTLHGFGTVVTGTLVAGTVKVEDEVEVQPGGRVLRVRGVQVHGGAVERAEAGQRTAVNLAGVEAGELKRGDVLTPVGLARAARVLDCRFELLHSALPLKHRAPIHLHLGTSEVEAEVRMLRGTAALEPGESGWVRLLLKEPVLALPGDRFIARMFSPVVTIGGGTVIDIDAPAGVKKSTVLERLPLLERADLRARVALLAEEERDGARVEELGQRCGVERGAVVAAAGDCLVLDGRVVTRGRLEEARGRVLAALRQHHRENPLLPGLPRASAPAPAGVVEALCGGEIVAEGEVLRLATHQPHLKAEEDAAGRRMEELFRAGGLAVPGVAEVLGQSGLEAKRARTVLELLLRQGRLVRVSPELICHAEAVSALRGLLGERKGVRFGVAEFKEWTGVSRKYAIPLLEFLDRQRVTRREGEGRVVL